MAAKAVHRMEQLPHEKRLKRLRLLRFLEEVAEAGVGIMSQGCKIMEVEDTVEAEPISTHPIQMKLWCRGI